MKYFFSCIIYLSLFIPVAFAQTAEAYFKQAEVKYSSKSYRDAIDLYSKAIKLDNSKINFFVRRGFCYSLLADYDSAIEDYSEVIRLDPKHKWAYLSRGSAKSKIGAYKNAIEDFDFVISLDPKDPEAYNNRGFAKKMLGDMPGACADYKKSKKLGNEEAKIILENNHCD